MRRFPRLVRRYRRGGGWAYGLAAAALLLGLIVAPLLVRVSAAEVFELRNPFVRQFALFSTLVGLAALTAGLGLSIRDDPFGVLSGGRNRYSLSRLQMGLWTWLILSGVIAAAACRAWGLGHATPGAALLVQLEPNLLAVMGISYFTGAATPGLLALKSAGPDREPAPMINRPDAARVGVSGQLVYRPPDFEARLIDLVDGDEASNAGSLDLSKLQQLVITLTLVSVYAVMLFHLFGSAGFVIADGPDKGLTKLPTLSIELVELLLVSHAGYLGYNAVSKPPPAQLSGPLKDGPPPTPPPGRRAMTFHIGDLIGLANHEAVSTAGCLVRFTDQPMRILLMGAAHGLVARDAQPGELVGAVDDREPIGRLQTWITFTEKITADVALVWIDPSRVKPASTSGKVPAPPRGAPRRRDKVWIVGGAGVPDRFGQIAATDRDVPLPVGGPGWRIDEVVYARQLVCEPMFTRPGDSGAIVVDKDDAVVGMVVAGRPLVQVGNDWVSQTVITPIASILNHSDFGGRVLEIVTSIPNGAVAPSLP